MEWTATKDRLPRERSLVLLVIPRDGGAAPTVAAGWLRMAAGDPDSLFFVVPGVGGSPTHWAPLHPDHLPIPGWPGFQREAE